MGARAQNMHALRRAHRALVAALARGENALAGALDPAINFKPASPEYRALLEKQCEAFHAQLQIMRDSVTIFDVELNKLHCAEAHLEVLHAAGFDTVMQVIDLYRKDVLAMLNGQDLELAVGLLALPLADTVQRRTLRSNMPTFQV